MSVRHGSWGAPVNTSHPVELAFLNAVWGGENRGEWKAQKKNVEREMKRKKGARRSCENVIYGRCSRLRAARLNRAQLEDSPSNRCGSMDTAITFAGQIQSWLADLGDGGGVEDGWAGYRLSCSPLDVLTACIPACSGAFVCVRARACVFKCNISSPWCGVDW